LVLDQNSTQNVHHGVVTPELSSQFIGKTIYTLYGQGRKLVGIVDVSTPDFRLKVFNQPSVDS
jgi:hypothetical protein